MAVKEYKFNSKEQLSAHFNISEFKCKCGGTHNIKIDTDLILMLEKLFSKLNCSKIIVNSGYRCSTHDRNVGGNGYGQHTKGTAADVVCYDKNGKIISTKIVSCVAQDLGYCGIANINNNYTAIHLDVRSGSKYYGNEIINYNTVCSDFYKYYGLSREYVNSFCAGETKQYYTVVKNDNLTKIAKKFNTTVAALVKLNNIKNPNLIVIGDKIRIK